ncbi:MAG: peptidylprolyl isomerase [Fimbriimonadaceae bacterium]|nr:peptidylprolyl isomerase [Fimbriimonadaceae bacterium]
METSKGTFELELFEDVAPRHAANLERLAREGFYDGLHVHRVEPNFVVQAGCPHTRDNARDPRAGTGGPGWLVDAEFNSKPHQRGTLGMARSADPNSAGSQWYICLAEARFLDHQYTVFGQVVGDGMTVVDQLRVGDQILAMTVGGADE